MKTNKKLLLTLTALCAISLNQNTQTGQEPILAETVEAPGNLVGSLFGGGYAKRSHNKRAREEEDSRKSKKSKREVSKSKKNKKSNSESTQSGNRRQRRRQARRSGSNTTEE